MAGDSEIMSSQVKVTQGVLQGRVRVSCDGKTYYSFEGIPYAKPPLGELRFRDPQEPELWTGIRDATKPGNICAQINLFAKKPIEGSEDCLYLNIYTPCLPAEKNKKLPVLFFVHGGRLLLGYGHYYQPDYFMRRDVILVTINYRLHILGFLCLNTFEVPGNAGLKDTVMALKWVKNNIGYFNGDLNNVTVFGESAGGAIVTSYLTSKMTDGLFGKVIAESGNCVTDLFMNDADPVEKAKKIAKILGEDISDVNKIRKFLIDVPIHDLITAVGKIESSKGPDETRSIFLPVVEKELDGVVRFFEQNPRLVLRENRFKKVPILKGLCSHEGAFFINSIRQGKIHFIRNLQTFIPDFLAIPHNTSKALTIAKRLHEFYFKGKEIDEKVLPEYTVLVSDAYFSRDTIEFVEYCTKKNTEKVYLYRFAYQGNMNTSIMEKLGLQGASHGDILPYQFYRKSKAEKCNKKDAEIINFLIEAWCNFASSGKPSWSLQEVEWLPYTPDNKCCLNIADKITMDPKMTWNNYEFWKSITEEKCKI